ncbi:4'-phosphopantetheinyl transferase family protein [Gorillibacterium sp. sgz500922]|uniref:4'-phosphopantetheinyl transferase family protein n=1 Tax=Gorillibacterium sp. sgz500922 TaxID=3446694 RepID=UPI003F67B630
MEGENEEIAGKTRIDEEERLPIRVDAVNLNDYSGCEPWFERLLHWTSPAKQSRIRCFRRREDAWRSLLADIGIRTSLSRQLNIPLGRIEFEVNPYGKPALRDNGELHFNASHSGEWVVWATAGQPVGIDIEQIRSIELDIARRFFSADEYRDLLSRDSRDQLSYFYDLWTLKESYIKAVGRGLSLPLNSFSCGLDEEGRARAGTNTDGWHFKQYRIDGNYKLSVCGREAAFCSEARVWTLEELCREACLLA